MTPLKVKPARRPEDQIKDKIKERLETYGWMVLVTHGNAYQSGLPDLYCMHPKYGARWIEVKNPKGYHFTAAQMEWFPKFMSCRIGVWVLVGSEDSELDKLHGPANWTAYLDIMR